MALRFEITDLTGFPVNTPKRVDLNGCAWFLRIVRPQAGQSMNGTPLVNLVTGSDSGGNDLLALDFPPIFDGSGRPVMWNQGLHFLFTVPVIAGCVIQVYWDPDLPAQPSR